MPDRSLRLLMFPPHPGQGGERGAVLLRERPASPPEAPDAPGEGRGGKDREDDNPFAPPPEGTPDRPWQPRHPAGGDRGTGADGQGSGHGGRGGQGGGPGGSPWGRWSDRQPEGSHGGFGERPGGGPEGQNGGGGGPAMRWDPSDPVQRRARYSLLCGMWAFFFVLFGWPYVALLLGALALYWGISGLRGRATSGDAERGGGDAGSGAGAAGTRGTGGATGTGRPPVTAAVTGLVTASLALLLVVAGFASQFLYRDYYTCTNDALTNEAKQSCKQLLPSELRTFLGDS
ncbi:hypothetical protein ACF1AL_18030 [Streptomyces sp. NPDC014801]|uniref:hypothetical protein n=1 Tax=Streptomyces sp. NPDC014801 TaxID=3364916 RepID=UPI003700289E